MLKMFAATILLSTSFFISNALAIAIDAQSIISAHNRWRAKVGVPKLVYSPSLAVSSQAWANHLRDTNQCKMRHSVPEGKYGENLFWASAMQWSDGRRELQIVSAKKVVDSWGSEKADYHYKKNSCLPGKMCGHYTQMVWRTTTEVGCAMAVCAKSQEQVWVCQYQPPGNWVGRKPY